MTTLPYSFFSTTELAPEETVHFGKPEDRVREAENLRQEYTKSKERARLSQLKKSDSYASSVSLEPEKKPEANSYESQLEVALKEVDKTDLNHLLNLVLTELRSRESDQIKKDVLTHSKKLRFKVPPEGFAPSGGTNA